MVLRLSRSFGIHWRSWLNQILLHSEVIDNEILSIRRVLAHVERQHVFHRLMVVDGHGVQSDVRPDEVFELVWRNFTQAFESCDLRIFP